MANKVVKFKRKWRAYNKDDIAGFSDDVADQLIKKKFAEDYSKEAAKELEARQKKDNK